VDSWPAAFGEGKSWDASNPPPENVPVHNPGRESQGDRMPPSESPRSSQNRFHTVVWFIAGRVVSTIVVNLVPRTVQPTTGADFLLVASGVNATMFVAVSVTISSVVRGQQKVAPAPDGHLTMRQRKGRKTRASR
jgi:hypothetical protein